MATVINEVEYSDWVLGKVNQKHRCSIDDVFDAIENNDSARWVEDDENGRRLLIYGRTTNRRLLRIYLFPIDEDAGTFRLGTVI